MALGNYGKRDRIWLNPTIRLRYETTPDQLRALIARLREIRAEHPRVADERVRLVDFGRPAVTVDASELKVIEPEAWELGRGRKFEGRVNVARENEKGNSESNEFDFDFTVKRSWRWHRVEGYGEIEYDTTRGFDSSELWTWMANYNRLFRSQW